MPSYRPITFMEALFPEEFEGVAAVQWMRGVVADGDPVAFVMTSETHGHQEGHYLWRMLVDRMHQRRGIGRRALVLVFDHLRELAHPTRRFGRRATMVPVDVTIRPMTMADTPDVGEVHVRAWQAAYRGVMPDEYLDGLRPEDRADMWRRGIEANWPGQRDVIAVDGHVAGFAAYGAEHEGDDPARGELFAVNLHPDYWRCGLGRQLIRHATDELSRLGFTTAVLWVEASNDRARRFYEVEGWQFDGTERADTALGAAVDEVRYARELDD